jgi:hypothetical protein
MLLSPAEAGAFNGGSMEPTRRQSAPLVGAALGVHGFLEIREPIADSSGSGGA